MKILLFLQGRTLGRRFFGSIELYQADWLLRYYHFSAEELLSEERPNFNLVLDPKCDWALRHLEYFPVEVNRADYQTLLRVPGIGYTSARRIVRARRTGTLDFTDLKKMGVVLKRALYFVTCKGKMMYPIRMDEDYILRNLLDPREKLPGRLGEITYRQLSLFDDMKIGEVGKMKRRYICTETMTGVLSAIYDAWTYDRSDQEAGIVFWGSVQQEMFCEYRK